MEGKQKEWPQKDCEEEMSIRCESHGGSGAWRGVRLGDGRMDQYSDIDDDYYYH